MKSYVPALLLLATLAACAGQDTPEPKKQTSPAPEARPVRIAMSAAFVSESGVPIYQDITSYLDQRIEGSVEFVTGLSYDTINDMLGSGDIDVGFICGLPYVLLHDQELPASELLVAPIMKDARYAGAPKYYSDLIVAKDSPYQKLEDLKGQKYAYNDELSNSGYNLPRWRLVQLGQSKGFFGQTVRSGSHEESIRMVATGAVAASYVDSLVLEYDQRSDQTFANQVRVIDSIGPAGIPPVVVSAKIDPQIRDTLKSALLHMHEDPIGRAILDKALLERFVEVQDSNYDDIRRMRSEALSAGIQTFH
jgi:phosphonate transport system substrate-binding protein